MGKLEEFYGMEENSLDYVTVGSSHAYCSVNPLEVWNSSEISGFVLATQQQPLRASYHYIKEVFKTQSPKYIILEGYMSFYRDEFSEGILYDAVDPLKTSVNKFEMINALVKPEDRLNYYFNIFKYHSRWKEVTFEEAETAFIRTGDVYKGYVALQRYFTGNNLIPDYDSVNADVLPAHNLETLNDILQLTQENGAELILILGPYNGSGKSFVAIFKGLKNWAEENNVEFIDYSLLLGELGIDPNVDYYDAEHLNASGAAKISAHLGQYLKEKGLTANPNADAEQWQADYDAFKEKFPA
ncbi:MAG: hypothetical protein IKK26_00335 [Clostridia bacterium]|nr:hypothetical protein [Clostridia bacterium]